MTLQRKSPPPRREATQSSYRPDMAPARSVMRKVSSGAAVARVAVVPKTPQRTSSRATAAESEHMGRVKKLHCVLCAALGLQQESITDVHHLREGQGGAQRASHYLTAALCHERCHQGPQGIHGDRSLLRQAKCTELDLLAWTLAALSKGVSS